MASWSFGEDGSIWYIEEWGDAPDQEKAMNEKHEDLAPATAAKCAKPKPWLGAVGWFPLALEAVARLSEYGATKHAADMDENRRGYLNVPDATSIYREARTRHEMAEAVEGPYDEAGGSHFLHAVQVAWNALAVVESMIYNDGMAVRAPGSFDNPLRDTCEPPEGRKEPEPKETAPSWAKVHFGYRVRFPGPPLAEEEERLLQWKMDDVMYAFLERR